VADEVQVGELEDEGLAQAGLERPVEGFEGLALGEAAGGDAALDAAGELVGGLLAEEALEERAGRRLLAARPGEVLVEVLAGVGQPEDVEVSSEPLEEVVG